MYRTISDTFWTGETGRALRGDPEAQVIALYLATNPHTNQIGLYYLPMPVLLHETGLSAEGASKGLRRAFEGGYATYHEPSEVVWVVEMARFQLGDTLKAGDNRRTRIIRELETYAKCPLSRDFHDRYAEPFGLPEMPSLGRGFEAPSKPLRRGTLPLPLPSEREVTSEHSPPTVAEREVATRRVRTWKRCPPDYVPPRETLVWAYERGLEPVEIREEYDAFMRCEFSKPHSDADATFRNWLHREAKEKRRRERRLGRDAQTQDAFASLLARFEDGIPEGSDDDGDPSDATPGRALARRMG